MPRYDDELRRLQQQAARKQQLQAMLQELYARQRELQDKTNQLQAIMMSEQADVDRLECGSLSAFFYGVLGKKEEKLTKEREEAYAARVKYDAAALELSVLEEDIGRKERELSGLSGCEEAYEELLQEKMEQLKRRGGAAAEEIIALDRRLAFIENQKREVREALDAGSYAMGTAREILNHLNSADSWATWDMFSDSCWTDFQKHDHLDQAQYLVQQLQIQLQRFRTELADVSMEIRADLHVNIEGFARFADFFFDDFFTDMMVRRRITDSMRQAESICTQIDMAMAHLEHQLQLMEEDEVRTGDKLEQLVRDTGLE